MPIIRGYLLQSAYVIACEENFTKTGLDNYIEVMLDFYHIYDGMPL